MNGRSILIIAVILIVVGGVFWLNTKKKNELIKNQCKVVSISSYGSGSNADDLSDEAISQRLSSVTKSYEDCLISHGLNK